MTPSHVEADKRRKSFFSRLSSNMSANMLGVLDAKKKKNAKGDAASVPKEANAHL